MNESRRTSEELGGTWHERGMSNDECLLNDEAQMTKRLAEQALCFPFFIASFVIPTNQSLAVDFDSDLDSDFDSDFVEPLSDLPLLPSEDFLSASAAFL